MFVLKLIQLFPATRVAVNVDLTKFVKFYSMQAWKVTNNSPKLSLVETRVPTITSPNDVLVQVYSSSVNPLDIRMRNGYGRRVLDILDLVTNSEPRITNDRYPLTLGRDFSGLIAAVGSDVTNYKVGDEVYGSIEPQRPGSQAQFAIVSESCLSHKPKNLTHNEAASIPFAAMTAWSALCTFGKLSPDNCATKPVLVLGGSGGVGSFAIQLLKIWGANVTATCSNKKIDWLIDSLYVDDAVSYEDQQQLEMLNGRFEFVLDCGAYDKTMQSHGQTVENSIKYLKPYKSSVYITLSPPFLKNTDENGLLLGTAKSAVEAAFDALVGLKSLSSARWAFYVPNKEALNYVTKLLNENTLRPLVWKEFSFGQIEGAYDELYSGNVRGKVVVEVTKNSVKTVSC